MTSEQIRQFAEACGRKYDEQLSVAAHTSLTEAIIACVLSAVSNSQTKGGDAK